MSLSKRSDDLPRAQSAANIRANVTMSVTSFPLPIWAGALAAVGCCFGAIAIVLYVTRPPAHLFSIAVMSFLAGVVAVAMFLTRGWSSLRAVFAGAVALGGYCSVTVAILRAGPAHAFRTMSPIALVLFLFTVAGLSVLILTRDRSRVHTALAAALAVSGFLSSACSIFYVNRPHAYRTLFSIALVLVLLNSAVLVALVLTRYHRLASVVVIAAVLGETAAVRAVGRFRHDFDAVEPGRPPDRPNTPPPLSIGSVQTPIAQGGRPQPDHPSVEEVPHASDKDYSEPQADIATTTSFDFPQFLGPMRNASVQNVVLREWTTRPPLVWKRSIGAAWSGFSVVNGYAVTMEQREEFETVTCYRVATGKLLWAHSTKARYARPDRGSGIGPRSTPSLHEGRVYSLGATGYLLCLNGATGKVIWERDLLRDYGVTPEAEGIDLPFGRCSSPLLVGDLVIVPTGGSRKQRVSLAAYNKNTGDLIWEGGDRQISYGSPALAELAGVMQIVTVNEDTASGHDVNTGRVLWQVLWPGNNSEDVNASQAVPVSPNRFFLSKSYGVGGALYQVEPSGDGLFRAEQVWANHAVMRTRLTNVAIKDGYIYGLSDGILECVHLESGKRIWKGGRYGHGQILRVGDSLLVLSESGEVVLIEASPTTANKVLGRFQAIEGISFNTFCLYRDFLLVRSDGEAACYRLPIAGAQDRVRFQ